VTEEVSHSTLGQTGRRVSRIALGTAQFWDERDEERAVATIRRAHELGVNVFDTARTYGAGRSEHILGRALRTELRRRDDVVISSKGGLRVTRAGAERDASPAHLRHDLEESLVALGVDEIDLYQVHWPDPKVPMSETAGALSDFVAEGKVRHPGLSNFDTGQVAEFGRTRPVEALQPSYHLFGRDIEGELLPYAEQHAMGVLVYGALGHGLLTGNLSAEAVFPPTDWRSRSPMYQGEVYRANIAVVRELERLARDGLGCTMGQLAIAFVLTNPAVHVAIVGTSRSDHLEEAIVAAELVLEPSVLARIDEIMLSARPSPGPTPETTPPSA
jgi:aryl-alcohol dehydrogenase-like predicted oxidoreductase